jgi:hypothetical protein
MNGKMQERQKKKKLNQQKIGQTRKRAEEKNEKKTQNQIRWVVDYAGGS